MYRPSVAHYIDRDICRPIYQSSLSRYVVWHVSTDTSRSLYRSSVRRYVDQHIGQVLVDMSTDLSVEGCTKYTWSKYNYHRVFVNGNWRKVMLLWFLLLLKSFLQFEDRFICNHCFLASVSDKMTFLCPSSLEYQASCQSMCLDEYLGDKSRNSHSKKFTW